MRQNSTKRLITQNNTMSEINLTTRNMEMQPKHTIKQIILMICDNEQWMTKIKGKSYTDVQTRGTFYIISSVVFASSMVSIHII